jgi:hypothetical protein
LSRIWHRELGQRIEYSEPNGACITSQATFQVPRAYESHELGKCLMSILVVKTTSKVVLRSIIDTENQLLQIITSYIVRHTSVTDPKQNHFSSFPTRYKKGPAIERKKMSGKAGGATAPSVEEQNKRVSLGDLERKKTNGVKMGALTLSGTIIGAAARNGGIGGMHSNNKNNNEKGDPATMTKSTTDHVDSFADATLPGAQRIGPTNSSSYHKNDDEEEDDDDGYHTNPMVDLATNNENGDVTLAEEDVMINAHIVDDKQLEAQIVARHAQEIRNQIMKEAVEATAVAENQIKNSSSPSFLQRYGIVLACFVVVIVGIIIIIVVVVVEPKNEMGDDNKLLTYQGLVDMLSPLSGGDVLLNETTPQFAALEWLTKDIESNTTSTFIATSSSMDVSNMLLERYSVALLYFATDGETWIDPLDFLSHNTSVCQWQSLQVSGEDALGIHCDSVGSVIKVQLGTYRCP